MTDPSAEQKSGENRPAAKLLPEVYAELRRLAAALTVKLQPGQTLQPTALVHEAYLRLVRNQDPGWDGRRPTAIVYPMRHSYLTLGGRAGIDLRTLQELAGHSTPTLTARYSHRRLFDLAGAVENLPSILPTAPEQAESLAATGTDGGIWLRNGCAFSDTGRDSSAPAGIATTSGDENDAGRNLLPMERVAAGLDSSRLAETRAGDGVDPNARITFRAPADAVYLIRATSYNAGRGTFTLTVRPKD
jgi:hypothetical protein